MLEQISPWPEIGLKQEVGSNLEVGPKVPGATLGLPEGCQEIPAGQVSGLSNPQFVQCFLQETA